MKASKTKSLINEVDEDITEDDVVTLISIHGGTSGSGASQVSELTDNSILARVGASNDFQNSSTTTNKFNKIQVDTIETLSNGSYTALAVADLSDNSSVAKSGASNDFQNSSATTNKFNTIEVDTLKTLSNGSYVDNVPRLDNTTNNFKSGQSQNNTSQFDVVEVDTIFVKKGNTEKTITSTEVGVAGLDASALVSGNLPLTRIPDSTLPIKKLDYGCFNEFRIATELGTSFIDSNGYETIKMITELYRFGTFPTDDEKLINFDGETSNGLIPLDSSDAAFSSGAHKEHTRGTYGPVLVYHNDVDIGADPQDRAALFNFDYHALTTTGDYFFSSTSHVNMASQVVAVTRGYVYTGAPTSLATNLKPRTTWKGNPFHSNIRDITDTSRTLWEVGVSSGEATRIKINDESIFVSANTIGTRGGTMGYKYKIFTNVGKYIYVETITMNPHNADVGYVGLVFRCLGVAPSS